MPAYAQVAFPIPVDRAFSYAVPEPLQSRIAVGKRVLAPFGRGNRGASGYCVGLAETSDYPNVKPLHRVLDDRSLLDAHMMALCRWIADYYACGYGEALEAALPASVRHDIRGRTRTWVSMAPGVDAESFAAEHYRRRPARRKALQRAAALTEPVPVDDLALLAGVGRPSVAALIKDGALLSEERHVIEEVLFEKVGKLAAYPVPTGEQSGAIDAVISAIEAQRFESFMLHGVTGSGKTEVYLRVIERVLDAGRQAIVLVPEISLTPQTVRRFQERFDRVAVLHSHLSASKRNLFWRALEDGEAAVVIGARSAIFAPLRRLGLIVVDEEHENSFKQDNAPRYNARDVAVKRGQMLGIPVVLGSATPSLETFHNAQLGRYTHLELTRRVAGRPMPPVEVVDMSSELSQGLGYRLLSQPLERHMRRSLDAGHQVILFQNRRGWSSWAMCRRCGFVLKCAECDVAMTLHRGRRDTLKCHYCGRLADPIETCPDCEHKLQYSGVGTQRLEDVLQRAFPQAAVGRMDSDTTRGAQGHEKILESFRRGDIQVLVGTQMVAKGLDFPNVTLVGVVNADMALNFPDFRSAERTFQLVAQVAGRAGRSDLGGRVVVQTFNPDHAAIVHSQQHDYLSFAREELAHRRALGYPPFGRLARVLAQSPKEPEAESAIRAARAAIEAAGLPDGVTLVGPAQAPIARIAGLHRWHMLIKAPSARPLRQTVAVLQERAAPKTSVQVSLDVDPIGML